VVEGDGVAQETAWRGERRGGMRNRRAPVRRGAVRREEEDYEDPVDYAVRVHASTGYTRVEGNRRAWRNGRVSFALPHLTRTLCVRRTLRLTTTRSPWGWTTK
jgi:hypothetical protein